MTSCNGTCISKCILETSFVEFTERNAKVNADDRNPCLHLFPCLCLSCVVDARMIDLLQNVDVSCRPFSTHFYFQRGNMAVFVDAFHGTSKLNDVCVRGDACTHHDVCDGVALSHSPSSYRLDLVSSPSSSLGWDCDFVFD